MSPDFTRRNLRLLYAFWFLRDFQLWIPVWIVFLTLDRGFSLTEVTVAEGLFLVAVVALEVPTGAVADHWGRSKSLALGAMVLGVCVLLFALINSFALLLTSFLLWSLAATLMSGADSALLFDTLKAAGREGEYERLAGRGTALRWAGAALATLLGGPVAALTDVSLTIYLGAATCVLTALAAFAIHEPVHRPAAGESHGTAGYWRSIGHAFGEASRDAGLRSVILLTGVTFAALESVGYLTQPYLVDRGIEVGVLFSLLQVPLIFAGVLGSLFAVRMQARVGNAGTLLGIPVAGSIFFAALALTPGLGAYAVLPLVYVLSSSLQPLATGYINRRVGSARRATVLSIHSMSASLVLAALSPALGFTTDRWGIPWAFALSAAVAFSALLGFGLRIPRATRDPDLAPAAPSEA